MRGMRLIHVLDAPELHAESAFWAGMLGGIVDAEDEWHSVIVDGEWRLGIQLAPNHVAPAWPQGQQQQQIHLDVWIDDLAEAHVRAMSLGATLLQTANDPATDGEVFQVYADPAGHPFCLCRGPLPE